MTQRKRSSSPYTDRLGDTSSYLDKWHKIPKLFFAKELKSQPNYSKTEPSVTGVIIGNNVQIETFVRRKQLPPCNSGN